MTDFLAGNGFPNTGSNLGRIPFNSTSSGLSTQIIIKVHNSPIGALQRLSVTQDRPLQRIQEIGTDGVIEIVPIGATTYELTAERIVFDQLRMPEAFSRNFRFIAAQRIPFDIDIIDIAGSTPNQSNTSNASGSVVMTYKNCWFTRYETPYAADNYIITESAGLWCETAYVVEPGTDGSLRNVDRETDADGIENDTNRGRRLGSLDASGLINSIFE